MLRRSRDDRRRILVGWRTGRSRHSECQLPLLQCSGCLRIGTYLGRSFFDQVNTLVQLSQLMVASRGVCEDLNTVQTH